MPGKITPANAKSVAKTSNPKIGIKHAAMTSVHVTIMEARAMLTVEEFQTLMFDKFNYGQAECPEGLAWDDGVQLILSHFLQLTHGAFSKKTIAGALVALQEIDRISKEE